MQCRIITMIILIICAHITRAQSTASTAGIQLLKKMNRTYQSGNISFNMQFRYATEAAPGEYLDSMKGVAAVSSNLYVYNLGDTKLIRTREYMISIFSEEKIMQVIPLNQHDSSSSMEPAGIGITMINVLDSLQQSGLIEISDSSAKGEQIITVLFNNHPSWKSAQYVIREADGLLQRTVMVTRMDELLGPGLQGKNLADGYAVVETIFSNYAMRGPEPGSTQSTGYFTRNGEDLQPVAAFKDYRIMLVQ